MTETKLLPCAYCQSPLELEWMSYEPYKIGGRWFVECTNLECPTHFNDEDKAKVIRAWNTRPKCEDCRFCNFQKVYLPRVWCNNLDFSATVDFYCKAFERKDR